MSTTLWTGRRWRVVVPDRPLTTEQLAIVDLLPRSTIDADAAAELITTYRRTRSALSSVGGSRGFQINFAVHWTPGPTVVGEPEPIADHDRVIHVFGRGGSDPTSPARAMARPPSLRTPATVSPARIASLTAALAAPSAITVAGPSETDCDGCAASVLTDQERWRADGIRVIRPHQVMIDSQVLLLPLRHLVSIGELTPEEVLSLTARLAEVRDQFALASGVTGLSCFGNDGIAARQETSHVHLHVFGRAADEAANPFALLASRLGPPAAPVSTTR